MRIERQMVWWTHSRCLFISIDEKNKQRKNIFSRSKSREPISGTVPATKTVQATFTTNKSLYDDKGMFTVFSESNRTSQLPPKSALSSRDYIRKRWVQLIVLHFMCIVYSHSAIESIMARENLFKISKSSKWSRKSSGKHLLIISRPQSYYERAKSKGKWSNLSVQKILKTVLSMKRMGTCFLLPAQAARTEGEGS